MTRLHALRQLLALGPLPFRELREITGWPPRQCSGLLRHLHETEVVAFAGGVWSLNDMRNLHPLEAQGIRRDGETPLRGLRARPEVAISPTAGYVSTAHASSSGNGASAYQVAGGVA